MNGDVTIDLGKSLRSEQRVTLASSFAIAVIGTSPRGTPNFNAELVADGSVLHRGVYVKSPS